LIVQGGEGGGHTGPVATTLLLPSVLDAVDNPGRRGGRVLRRAAGWLRRCRTAPRGVAMGTPVSC